MGSVFREKYGLFRCGKSAADHKDFLAREKFPIAGRTIRNAPAFKLCFSGKAHHPGMGTGSKNDTQAGKRSPVCHHLPYVLGKIQFLHTGQQKFTVEGFCLLPHPVRQCSAANRTAARIIHHFGSNGNLSPEGFFFNHQNPIAGPCQIQTGGKARRPSADHNRIIKVCVFHHMVRPAYSAPTKSSVGFKVLAPGCHLAGHT